MDAFVPAEITLGATHHLYPEYYLFGTEACAGFSPLDRGVKLGSWQRAEQYARDIIEVRESWLGAVEADPAVKDVPFQGESPPSPPPSPPLLQCSFGGLHMAACRMRS